MVLRASLLSCSLFAAVSATSAFAQENTTTIVREAVPVQSKAIIANSPEDIALQEEIRKIRAYNQYVDSQVGISTTETTIIAPEEPIAETKTYTGAKIELFEPTQASTTISAPTTIIIERQPVAGMTSIYRVVEGDTLYNLSKRNCISVENIKNQNQLSNSNIQLGQVLTIPASQCVNNVTASTGQAGYIPNVAPTPATARATTSNSYAVLPKDSLYSIGKRYCLTASELAVANGISTATTIQPGQVLQLPNKACVK